MTKETAEITQLKDRIARLRRALKDIEQQDSVGGELGAIAYDALERDNKKALAVAPHQ